MNFIPDKEQRKESSSSSEDESIFDIELEEQKKIWEEIKSGKANGLSVYDLVKRRSHRQKDEKKKAKFSENNSDIELEEQRKILEEIKSGKAKADGLTMYDRIKRRHASKRPEDEKKKAKLSEKQAK